MDQSIGDIRIAYVVSRIIVIDKKVRHCLYRYEIRMQQSGSGQGPGWGRGGGGGGGEGGRV